MNRDRHRVAFHSDARQNAIVNEFDAVLHRESSTQVAFHPVSAGTRVEHDGQPAPLARLEKRSFELGRLAIRDVDKTFAFEGLAATELVEMSG